MSKFCETHFTKSAFCLESSNTAPHFLQCESKTILHVRKNFLAQCQNGPFNESQPDQLKFMLFLLFTSQYLLTLHAKFSKAIGTDATFKFQYIDYIHVHVDCIVGYVVDVTCVTLKTVIIGMDLTKHFTKLQLNVMLCRYCSDSLKMVSAAFVM